MRHACHRVLNMDVHVIRSLALVGMYFVCKNSRHIHSTFYWYYHTKLIKVLTTATVRLTFILVSMVNK